MAVSTKSNAKLYQQDCFSFLKRPYTVFAPHACRRGADKWRDRGAEEWSEMQGVCICACLRCSWRVYLIWLVVITAISIWTGIVNVCKIQSMWNKFAINRTLLEVYDWCQTAQTRPTQLQYPKRATAEHQHKYALIIANKALIEIFTIYFELFDAWCQDRLFVDIVVVDATKSTKTALISRKMVWTGESREDTVKVGR